MTLKDKIIVLSLVFIGGALVGRYSVPESIKTAEQVTQIDDKDQQTDADKNTHKETTTTEIDRPDGTKEKTTTVVNDTNVDKKTVVADDKSNTDTKSTEIVTSTSKVTISALAGANLNSFTVVYGMSATKSVLGPITLGAFGFSNGMFGGSLGLQF